MLILKCYLKSKSKFDPQFPEVPALIPVCSPISALFPIFYNNKHKQTDKAALGFDKLNPCTITDS